MNKNMYREHILDLYKNPSNFGELSNCTHEADSKNPSCGDELKLQLIIKNNKIEDVKFKGYGCAISIASTSLLTDKIKGLDINKVKTLKNEDILDLLGIDISYSRMKCALLSIETLREAIK